MSSRTEPNTGGRDARVLIQKHADVLRHAPTHPETFVAEDLPGTVFGALLSLRNAGVVEKVGYTNFDDRPDYENERVVYKLHPWVGDVLETVLDNRDVMCPCGHAGLSNCGDHYECHFDPCDKEFQRDELEVE